MSESSNNFNSPLRNNKILWNRLWLFTGLLPFFFSFLLCVAFDNPKWFFAPLFGFWPYDFRGLSSASTEQIVSWDWISGFICFAFAICAFFVRPFGILFAMATWASTALFFYRIYEAFKNVDS